MPRNTNRARIGRTAKADLGSVSLVRKGSFSRSAPIGRSKVAFSGRIGRRALKPGRYVLRATPTDAAGNVGAARTVSITIVR